MSRPTVVLIRLMLGVLLPLLPVGVFAESVLDGDRFAFEVPLLLAIHAHHSLLLDRLALLLSDLGGVDVIAPASAALLVYFWVRQRPLALFFAAAVGGSALVTVLMKLLLPRLRPELWPRLVPEADASFPSGHAMYSLALLLALLLLFWPAPGFSGWRWPASLLALAFTLGVGVSRLYLGVHYPSDVLAGWLSGLAWVLAVYTLMRPRRPVPDGPGGSLGWPGTAQ